MDLNYTKAELEDLLSTAEKAVLADLLSRTTYHLVRNLIRDLLRMHKLRDGLLAEAGLDKPQ